MRYFYVLALLVCFAMGLYGQTITVMGTVRDAETNEPLVGVSILQQGAENGTVTDFEGAYTMKARLTNGAMYFSYVGYESQQIEIDGRTEIDIYLSPQSIKL
ncbi:MAG: carboxypeptidase-like regulatory domain-containing protein, partial [Bacteroidota bacterium]